MCKYIHIHTYYIYMKNWGLNIEDFLTNWIHALFNIISNNFIFSFHSLRLNFSHVPPSQIKIFFKHPVRNPDSLLQFCHTQLHESVIKNCQHERWLHESVWMVSFEIRFKFKIIIGLARLSNAGSISFLNDWNYLLELKWKTELHMIKLLHSGL